MSSTDQLGFSFRPVDRRVWTVRDLVVTLRLKVAGTVELNGSLAGTEQFAPVGEPVQLSDAVPLSPAPPIDSV